MRQFLRNSGRSKKLVSQFAALFLISGLLSSESYAADLLNISTRGFAGAAGETLTPGFIVTGSGSIQVLIKVTGPSLPSSITGRLLDPKFTLTRTTQDGPVEVLSNDNWEDGQTAPLVQATGLAPANPLEPAAVVSLDPGAYTVLVSGVGGATGIALPSVTEVDETGGLEPIYLLVGTYNLTGFSIDYVDGSTITDDDASSFSGDMTISEGGIICQTLSINGQTLGPNCGDVEVPNSTTWLVTQSGCTYSVSYSYNSPNLTTTSPRFICGFDTGYIETDYWIKTSAKVSILAKSSAFNDSLAPSLGMGVSELLQYKEGITVAPYHLH